MSRWYTKTTVTLDNSAVGTTPGNHSKMKKHAGTKDSQGFFSSQSKLAT